MKKKKFEVMIDSSAIIEAANEAEATEAVLEMLHDTDGAGDTEQELVVVDVRVGAKITGVREVPDDEDDETPVATTSPKFEVVDDTITQLRKTRVYRIDLVGTDKEVSVRKWWIDDEYETEVDWEWEGEDDEKVYKALDEDTQEDLTEFISELGD